MSWRHSDYGENVKKYSGFLQIYEKLFQGSTAQ
jgi:hypothetical protein